MTCADCGRYRVRLNERERELRRAARTAVTRESARSVAAVETAKAERDRMREILAHHEATHSERRSA